MSQVADQIVDVLDGYVVVFRGHAFGPRPTFAEAERLLLAHRVRRDLEDDIVLSEPKKRPLWMPRDDEGNEEDYGETD